MASSAQVGLAFGLVIAAGLCTCLGACIAFCVKLSDQRVLAAALGVSAGVMLYVSFVEIFTSKSVSGFLEAGFSESHSQRYATFMFFGGMVFTWILNQVAHAILHLSDRCGSDAAVKTPQDTQESPDSQATGDALDQATAPPEQVVTQDVEANKANVHVACCDGREPQHAAGSLPEEQTAIAEVLKADHHRHLTRMGLLSCLAVGIHNFPEGLATFVGTLADPRAGVGIAVAIALHNIPEGIVVAMPIYYATGSKWKGFLWSAVCGLSEPIAGLMGWLILRGRDSDPLMYAVMFAIVAGMMVYISIVELIPTALRYDVENRYTTRGLVIGMVVMAASLLLFKV